MGNAPPPQYKLPSTIGFTLFSVIYKRFRFVCKQGRGLGVFYQTILNFLLIFVLFFMLFSNQLYFICEIVTLLYFFIQALVYQLNGEARIEAGPKRV